VPVIGPRDRQRQSARSLPRDWWLPPVILQRFRVRTEQLLRRTAAALTPSLVRFHAVALGAGIWIAALVTLSTRGPLDRHGLLKGMDFLQFHAAGRMIAEGRHDELYDWTAFAGVVQHTVPGTGDLLFLSVYPPQLALMFAPFGRLEYLAALGLWTACSVALCACCVWALLGASPAFRDRRSTWWLAAAAFTPFHQLVIHGQIAALALVCFTGAWLALRRDAWWWFGAALGSLAFKPQFAAAAVLAVLVSRNGRVAIGAAGAAVLQGALTVLWLGVLPFQEYLLKVPVILRSAALFEPKLWQMHNLKSFCGLLMGTGLLGTVAAATLSMVVVYFVYATWRDTRRADIRVSSLVLGAVLVNPHLYVYDLVVLAVPLALMTAWAIESRQTFHAATVLVSVHALCWLPLLGPAAAVTRLQLSVPVMFVLLLCVRSVAGGLAAATRVRGRNDVPVNAITGAGVALAKELRGPSSDRRHTVPPTRRAAGVWPPALPVARLRS
jgi:hypothetical protein